MIPKIFSPCNIISRQPVSGTGYEPDRLSESINFFLLIAVGLIILVFMIDVRQWRRAPNTSGVYIFRKGNFPLYIGKAADLKKRLSSYFSKKSGGKAEQLVAEATKLDWIETSSEVEAFLKEAELIKKYRPKYNYLLRDDKNYFYVGITRDVFPRIFITHQPVRKVSGVRFQMSDASTKYPTPNTYNLTPRYIGPFTSGSALKSVLCLLRRIFPYCTCRRPHKRSCLNFQIGRCPGYCCIKTMHVTRNAMHEDEYQKNIKRIVEVLSGKKQNLLNKIYKEMRMAAKSQDFERAAKIRDQIEGLENIFAHRRFLTMPPETQTRFGAACKQWPYIEKYIRQLLGIKEKISRVEGYDISNISGTEATGSMVVFIDGAPLKSEYRKFRIKTVHGANDVAMLKEVIRRRLAHTEWPYPDLMLIDGGRPQLGAAQAAKSQITNHKSQTNSKSQNSKIQNIYVTALAKNHEGLYTEKRSSPISLKSVPAQVRYFFQRVRDEAHRFAKKYHHQRREIFYRGQ